MSNKYEQFKQYPTEPGWYCIGWDREDPKDQEDFGPHFDDIYEFDGENWYDADGRDKDSLWDAVLQMPVSMGAADYYVKQ